MKATARTEQQLQLQQQRPLQDNIATLPFTCSSCQSAVAVILPILPSCLAVAVAVVVDRVCPIIEAR
jgi:hypothetical protein